MKTKTILTWILFSSVFIIFLITIIPNPTKNNNSVNGVNIKYFYDLFDGTRVYYNGFVPYQGIGTFELIGICSSVTNECRNPTKQESLENKYLPQNSE